MKNPHPHRKYIFRGKKSNHVWFFSLIFVLADLVRYERSACCAVQEECIYEINETVMAVMVRGGDANTGDVTLLAGVAGRGCRPPRIRRKKQNQTEKKNISGVTFTAVSHCCATTGLAAGFNRIGYIQWHLRLNPDRNGCVNPLGLMSGHLLQLLASRGVGERSSWGPRGLDGLRLRWRWRGSSLMELDVYWMMASTCSIR